MAIEEDNNTQLSDVEGSEGEGDNLRQEEPFDSSEEEEDDDEEEIQKIREGFIVDDEDDDDSSKRRKKKHRRRHQEKEDEGLLDEDDLDLLMENTGVADVKEKSTFKRLKRAPVSEEPEKIKDLQDFFSEDEDIDMADAPTSRTKPSGMDELDDFIEDDEFSDMDEETRQAARERRKQERLKPIEITGIDSEKIDELYDIFGDGQDYAWALEGEEEDGEYREDDTRPQLQDIYEPEELKARMLTDNDKIIRDTDIPERYQMMRKSIKNYELDEPDFEYEKAWISHRLIVENQLNEKQNFDNEAFVRAVGDVLTFVAKQNLEVPFIYSHRRDHLLKTIIVGEGDEAQTEVDTLLVENNLWRIVQMDIEFHALMEKRNQVNQLIAQLDVQDGIMNEAVNEARSITDLQDIYEYINFTYSQQLKDLGLKKHQKSSIYDKIKDNRLLELVKAIGISAFELAENITANTRLYNTKDNEQTPQVLAEVICEDQDSLYAKPSQALEVTKRYFAEQLSTNLKLRKHLRHVFAEYSTVKIELTEQGRLKIDKNSPYADFKYAINRKHDSMYTQPDLFLRMLEAESLNLVEVKLEIPSSDGFFESILNLFASDGQSDLANDWNNYRRSALEISLKKLIPLVSLNLKEEIRRECERLLFFEVRNEFLQKIDRAPYHAPSKKFGSIPNVLAISPGNGKFGADAVVGAFLDEYGKLVQTFKFNENPRLSADRLKEGETSFEMAFSEAVKEVRPDVIAINGFNVNTNKLFKIIQTIIANYDLKSGTSDNNLDIIYVNDEVASRYQNSTKSLAEFPDKPSLVRYTISLARYVQSPLLEYLNLGDDVSALSIHKHQGLLSEDMLKEALSTAFVDIVNMVGVDINKCVSDSYLAATLPYISGLGDRKAFGLLRAVQQNPLFSRQALITNENIRIGTTIFLNCASFLRIPQSKNRAISSDEDVEAVTLLDETRIHPEDYALAEKMAADALDLDEDQIEELKDAPIGETIIDRLLNAEEGATLLQSLVLEDYSRQLEEAYNKKKRATLQMILEELQDPYAEIRGSFKVMNSTEVFESLTGESPDALFRGVVVPMLIMRVNDFRVMGVTSSSIDCTANADFARTPRDRRRLAEIYQQGQTIPAAIQSIDYENFSAEVSLLERDVKQTIQQVKFSKDPQIWDVIKEEADENAERYKNEVGQKAARVIKHPLFHNYNSIQAQNFLAPKERGFAVIRPSSKGNNHIAITWKVDNNLFQHIDVVEHEKENEYSLGRYLTIEKLRFSDLDEILETYVSEIVKRVNQMTDHDKFRSGTKDEVVEWIENYSKANPKRGVYAFAFNYKRPGWFLLLFKTGPQSEIYTWNVKAVPTGYDLNGYAYPTVQSLCNGFKTLLKNKSQGRGY
jgi:transcription elongation factor SPT6